MPLFSTKGGWIYLAHVPRTGGSSLEDYLAARFGPPSLLDRDWMRAWADGGWRSDSLVTSPQHLTAADAARLLPRETTRSIAVVRDPVARIVSEYRFQTRRGLRRRRLTAFGFATWLRLVLAAARRDPRIFDNHIRPQDDIVPENAEVFHLDAGFSGLIERLDAISGTSAPEIGVGSHEPESFRGPVAPSRADLALIGRFYAADYARFGFAPPDPAAAAPDRLAPVRRILGEILAPVAVGMYSRGRL